MTQAQNTRPVFKGGQTITRTLLLIVTLILAACASHPVGGPTAPRSATDAGTLTLPTGRRYAIYPADLAFTGHARYRWPDGRTYEGGFGAGRPDGIGVGTWPNGDRYHGTWLAGRKHGHGELTRADGSRYRGDFEADQRSGQGTEQSAEGLYRGQWANDLPNGTGRFHDPDGATYEGEWVDGRRQGRGTYRDGRGSTYAGDWHADVPDGFGVLTHDDGSSYDGAWHDGTQQGYGASVSTAGVVYEGTWVLGQRHGYGVARRGDGSAYEGEWAAGRRSGRGRERFADGSEHDGTWLADQPHGPGSRRDRTGIEIMGVWNGDTVFSGTLALPSGASYTGRLLGRRNTEVDPGLLTWLEARAAADDPYAQFFLGTAYADFRSPVPDSFRATRHFRAAARAGIPDGQFRLALLLMVRSPDQAMAWLARAAAGGQAQANALLGEYYLTGMRVEADEVRAVAYLRAGSNAGDMGARTNLAWVLATTERPELKDGEQALALIRPLALMQGDWQHLDTLAAAYAATHRYGEASRTQLRALSDARRLLGPQSPEVIAMQQRLARYRSLAVDD